MSTDQLPEIICIANHDIDIELLQTYSGLLGHNILFAHYETLLSVERGHGLIFTTGGYSFSLIWANDSVYLFDSHGRDINGLFTEDGSAVLSLYL